VNKELDGLKKLMDEKLPMINQLIKQKGIEFLMLNSKA